MRYSISSVREHGAALLVTMLSLVGLLSVGAVAILAAQSELASAGQRRFGQSALYAAESGAAAGVDFLRATCNARDLFSSLVEANNVSPIKPSGLYGNSLHAGTTGAPFSAESDTWYEVEVLNNQTDEGYSRGDDTDAMVTLRATGHGPGGSQAIIEVDVKDEGCLRNFCDQEFAQRGMTARNDAYASCTQRVDPTGAARILNPGD